MNRVILCEGVTDAILLSYFLGRVSGWKYTKKAPDGVNIKADSRLGQSADWYEKEKEHLLICAVGGKDNMSSFFKSKIERPIEDAGAFSKFAVVLDRDNYEIASIEARASSHFNPIITKLSNNCWVQNSYSDSFTMNQTIDALLVVIPTEHEGALETVMLDAISEEPYDGDIVKKSIDFVAEMRTTAARYIKSNRLELKARLGVTWAIQYPEKVFSLIDEQIKSVEWEKSNVLLNCFSQLLNI